MRLIGWRTPRGPRIGLVGAALRVARDGDRAAAMGSIDRYIFRTTLASFALVLVSLTGVIWMTQALRGIDLMTSQGQTILTFLGITSLVIPVAGAGHRADRADDRGRLHAEQARHRFRNHRHERRRHVAVPAVPCRSSTPRCVVVAAGRVHRRLSRAGRHAPRCKRWDRRNHRRRAHQHPAARPLRAARTRTSRSASANASPAACWSASSSTTAAIPKERVTHHRRPRHGAEERDAARS